jgi:hypothetical protein
MSYWRSLLPFFFTDVSVSPLLRINPFSKGLPPPSHPRLVKTYSPRGINLPVNLDIKCPGSVWKNILRRHILIAIVPAGTLKPFFKLSRRHKSALLSFAINCNCNLAESTYRRNKFLSFRKWWWNDPNLNVRLFLSRDVMVSHAINLSLSIRNIIAIYNRVRT